MTEKSSTVKHHSRKLEFRMGLSFIVIRSTMISGDLHAVSQLCCLNASVTVRREHTHVHHVAVIRQNILLCKMHDLFTFNQDGS